MIATCSKCLRLFEATSTLGETADVCLDCLGVPVLRPATREWICKGCGTEVLSIGMPSDKTLCDDCILKELRTVDGNPRT